MSASEKPPFLVNSTKESVFILINGKATFLNASTFKRFIDASIKDFHPFFVIDFKNCTGMDSTFLGILAWLGMKIRESKHRSFLIVRNLNKRNTELFQNLGLHNFISTEEALRAEGTDCADSEQAFTPLEETQKFQAMDILDAHKNLVLASKSNALLFKDVIKILENKVNEE